MKLVTRAVVEECGCKPEDVSVVFEDIDRRDWGKAGIIYCEK
jgi:phenylpyruvate tautomerase PptA (4-oxalocrotonate tautomerase family)